jgi:hypothetical protein
LKRLASSVADPYHFDSNPDSDPDPAFYFDADPEPVFHFDADPEPAFHHITDPDPTSLNNTDTVEHCLQVQKTV